MSRLTLGGVRCHYVIMPLKSSAVFHVYDFETQQKVNPSQNFTFPAILKLL
jgi:hypothetical protein